jgi:hypothetical protein
MFEFFRNQARALRAATSRAAAGLQYHPSSYADPHGRLFVDQGRLYRGVPPASVPQVARLLDSGVIGELVKQRLLVPTRRAALRVEEYPLVLEHERVPHVSYPYEWSAEMLRAAALHTLAVLEALAPHGLTLKDAHGWNVVFEGCRPVFVDVGSIIEAPPGGRPWRAEREFQEYLLHPLAMMGSGHDRIARALLRDFEEGIPLSLCAAIVGLGVPQRPEVAEPFGWYRELISGYDFRPGATPWSGYYQDAFPALTPDAAWTEKHHAVQRLLQQQRPASVLDIGSNRGWYALLAAAGGARVVAFDNDATCINQLYTDAVARGLDVQPLVMSCLNPSPRLGLGDGVMEPASDRLDCELVLALALVHHMVFKMHLNFEQIAAGLAVYARKTLIVEFPPRDDAHVSQWMTAGHAWYTVENFMAALRRHFPKLTTVASHPAPRVLLVCER